MYEYLLGAGGKVGGYSEGGGRSSRPDPADNRSERGFWNLGNSR